jgi:hypothetical protein
MIMEAKAFLSLPFSKAIFHNQSLTTTPLSIGLSTAYLKLSMVVAAASPIL